MVARGRLEADLARLVGGAEAEGVSLVHRRVLHLVDRLHFRVRELAPPLEEEEKEEEEKTVSLAVRAEIA